MKKKTHIFVFITLLIAIFLSTPHIAKARNRPTERDLQNNFFNLYQQYKQNQLRVSDQEWSDIKSDWIKLITLESELTNQIAQKEQELYQKAKERMLEFCNRILDFLNDTKTKIDEDEDIDDATKAELIAFVDEQINWVNNQKSAIQQATTIEELKAIAEESQAYWEDKKVEAKILIAKVVVVKLDKMVEKAEELFADAEEKIQLLKDMGYDTTEAESLLAQARADFEKAKAEYAKARELLLSATSKEDIDEAREYLNQATVYLRSMADKIKRAIESVKEQIEANPPENLPSGDFPTGDFPTGAFPTGEWFPSGAFPTGEWFPSGAFPTGEWFPSGAFPTDAQYPTYQPTPFPTRRQWS